MPDLQRRYKVSEVEDFHPNSGKPEKQSKRLLSQLTQDCLHQVAGTEFRERVAEQTDILELEKHCPRGFRPFAEKLRAAFGPR